MDSTPPRHAGQPETSYERASGATRARVAVASSYSATPSKKEARARASEVLDAKSNGPALTVPYQADPLFLREVATRYTALTGDPVKTEKKLRFVAVCYRIHGDDFLPLVAELFADTGTATNLLLRVRSHPRRATEPAPQAEPRLHVVEARTVPSGTDDRPPGNRLPTATRSTVVEPAQLSTAGQLPAVTSETPDDGWLDTPAGRAAREQWDPIPASAGPKPAQVAAIYADLPYGPDESPPFDPNSDVRHDQVAGHDAELYRAHQSAIRRADGRWTCDICEAAA